MVLSRRLLGPDSANCSMPSRVSLCSVPTSERGVASDSATARNVVPGPIAVSVRSNHPVWTAVVAVPRSRQSWAWKWLRLASGEATACTAAIWPAFQNGAAARAAGAARTGSRRASSALSGTTRVGRAFFRLASLAGTTMLRPSMPPRMNTMTSVRLLVAGSAKEYLVVTSWVPSAATPTAPAPAMTRRRVKPRRHRSFSGRGRRRPSRPPRGWRPRRGWDRTGAVRPRCASRHAGGLDGVSVRSSRRSTRASLCTQSSDLTAARGRRSRGPAGPGSRPCRRDGGP
jgi:hypothetical protein